MRRLLLALPVLGLLPALAVGGPTALTASTRPLPGISASGLAALTDPALERGDEMVAQRGGTIPTGAWLKASAQAQWQTSKTSRSWLLTGAVVNKLDQEWTLLNRALYSVQTNLASGGGNHELVSAQSGFSYRPVETDVWNALGRIQYKRDADNTLGTGLNRDESAWIVSSHLNVQPQRRWLVTGRYAAKVAKDQSNGLQSRSITQLAGARSTWDLSDGWDVGLQAYRTWGNGVAETALGIEAGYVVWKNFWLSLGYNIKGFRAPDLAGEAYTQHGIYLRMRLKFDENLLQGASE